MKKLLLALLLSSCSFSFDRDPGPGELRGTIVYQDDKAVSTPAPGAIISLEGSGVSVRSDAKGRFIIRGLPAGRYAVRITHDAGGASGPAGLRLRDVLLETGGAGKADGRDLGTLVIGGLGSIRGKLVKNGDPTDGRVVLAGTREAKTTSAAYEFTGLLPGFYDVAAIDRGGGVSARRSR